MKKKANRKKSVAAQRRVLSRPLSVTFVIAAVITCAAIGGLSWWRGRQARVEKKYVPRARGEITFNKHIAPIIFEHCAECHRPGQSAPFALLNYADVKKRATDIAAVTSRRYMPPWLPEHGFAEFAGERRLTAEQIGMIQQWAAEGAVEGNAVDLPVPPKWSGEWRLGQPDLVVNVPTGYTLSAEGRDVYRNFVIPTLIPKMRYVRAVELRPGNPKILHHAFIKVDRTQQSRRLDEQDPAPGFPGMNVRSAEMPDGHFLGWQPGRGPCVMPEGLAWRLDPGNDLVLETHLNPSGKAEPFTASIGLFFTDQPPTNTCFKIGLTSFVVDIPAGESKYVVEDSFVLPVDVQVLAVLPHAHYLAREMQGWATLPSGGKKPLLFIKEWDFNWQSDYRYAKPLALPKGTALSMRFTYDNSTNNVRNPNNPPKPVTYGPQSSDEMAELWLQLLPRDQGDLEMLARASRANMLRLFFASAEYEVRKNPANAKARAELGMLLFNEQRWPEAEQQFRAAIRAQPEYAPGHYDLGLLLRARNELGEARVEFETALRLDPTNFKAHGNLGLICLSEGDIETARSHFESALRLNPDDAVARESLEDIRQGRVTRARKN